MPMAAREQELRSNSVEPSKAYLTYKDSQENFYQLPVVVKKNEEKGSKVNSHRYLTREQKLKEKQSVTIPAIKNNQTIESSSSRLSQPKVRLGQQFK